MSDEVEDTFDVSKGAAYAVLYSVLGFFTLLALGSAGYFSFLPDAATNCCTLKGHKKRTDDELTGFGTDYFLSARNSAGTWAIALSFFAGGMGAWVLYGTTEMGATPELSWLGVLGYSGASSCPAIIICFLGPMVRERSEKAFSTTDFGRKRYGRVMQVSIAAVSGFYMFIFIVAELTAISGIFAILTNNFAKKFEIGVTVSLGAITVLYTSIAGLPASIVTDRFQGILMAILVIMLLFAVTLEPENHVTRDEFALASNWTTQGLKAAVTLFIAIACAELFNQSTWQRVWAAESVPAMRKGFGLGSLLVFFLMMFFGVMGMIAYANDPESYDNGFKYPYLAFFDLLLPLKDAWHIITLILVTALAASSIDSLQNGLSCIFARDLVKIGWHPTWVARFLIVAINAPAIYMASKKFNVISLFLVADIVCATSVFPVFLGLQTKDRGILKAPTEVGAFLGCIAGLLTIIVIGIIQGSVSDAFWLRNGGICALCGTETMVSFLVVPSISFVATYLCSYIDLKIRGDRARRPIFPVPFDQDDEGKEAKDLEDCRSSEDSPTDSPTDDKAVDDSELQEVLEGVNLDDEDSVNTEKIQATHEGGGTY